MAEQPKVGHLIDGEANRDAIHVAIAPVEAAEKLAPGQDVGLTAEGKASAKAMPSVGIVDPYLDGTVPLGQRFYLFLYPGTVTSLRHEWEHPAFAKKVEPVSKDVHRLFVEKTAAQCGYTVEKLMDACTRYAESNGEDYVATGEDSGYQSVDFGDEFWDHFSAFTGIKKPKWTGAPFSCSC